jgi:hypothetical protein
MALSVTNTVTHRVERYGWALVMAVLIALAVPWFLWGDSRVAFGLPVWLWWHIGWMGLTTALFYAFADRAWGLGIETTTTDREPGSSGQRPVDSGGEP